MKKDKKKSSGKTSTDKTAKQQAIIERLKKFAKLPDKLTAKYESVATDEKKLQAIIDDENIVLSEKLSRLQTYLDTMRRKYGLRHQKQKFFAVSNDIYYATAQYRKKSLYDFLAETNDDEQIENGVNSWKINKHLQDIFIKGNQILDAGGEVVTTGIELKTPNEIGLFFEICKIYNECKNTKIRISTHELAKSVFQETKITPERRERINRIIDDLSARKMFIEIKDKKGKTSIFASASLWNINITLGDETTKSQIIELTLNTPFKIIKENGFQQLPENYNEIMKGNKRMANVNAFHWINGEFNFKKNAIKEIAESNFNEIIKGQSRKNKTKKQEREERNTAIEFLKEKKIIRKYKRESRPDGIYLIFERGEIYDIRFKDETAANDIDTDNKN